MAKHPSGAIAVHGARQNNLKNLDLEIPLGELVVVTGVSGSGKSSLVFDTLYAEGQRRYVETFSPYARQFLDRMDKPQVDRVLGIPPAIAIDQTNPVRSSRSTVGTMTELNDHLKLLYARAATLFCERCAEPVRRDTPDSIFDDLARRAAAAGDPRLELVFPVAVPKNFPEAEVRDLLARQGYTRILDRTNPGAPLEVVQDRFRMGQAERARVIDSLEAALRHGTGRVTVRGGAEPWHYSRDLACARCDIAYREPAPSAFSFNSPIGACETCRGFGRVIGIDYGLVIPDETKTLRAGAIKPFQTAANRECQEDLEKYAKQRGIPLDTPWHSLTATQRKWVIEGEGSWRKKVWYGTKRFFDWLEGRAYRMHVRVMLSKYRAYTPCTACGGARLKTSSLLPRLGSHALAAATLGERPRFLPHGVAWTPERLAALPGLCIHDLVLLPLSRTREFVDALRLPEPMDVATGQLLAEIRTRLRFLVDVGLGYLTLDRQSRTLSGGEVQRINLTTALGTSLVNTLFVLDEPSIGLHPRDMGRVIEVMHRLRDAGNSLIVVEHDPQIMLEADRLLDLGPGAGEHGGEIVYYGAPDGIRTAPRSLTGAYLSGAHTVAAPGRDDPGASASDAGSAVRDAAEGIARAVRASSALVLRGVREHNLKGIDVTIPLRRLVCVTGVSGSGKSTLVGNVLYPALAKTFGKATDALGSFDSLEGAGHLDDVVLVDQSRIGRTTRSTPASYVGALDVIRELFAAAPEALVRRYTPGTFSFNSGTGRCPTCGGNGFEHIEMQFLSDVYLRCATCDGRRFRDEVLEVRLEGAGGRHANIADVLEMTVTEALGFFANASAVRALVKPLQEVGLEYLKLGQPVPTLSGGEAQRLKLAGHLAELVAPPPKRAAEVQTRGKLFLFDEPTTGLHFDDVAKLLRALRGLLTAGHSLLVIEHNLDVIRAADWIIDLGPEGGEQGGTIVCAGTPRQVREHPASHTGRALRDHETALGRPTPAAGVADAPPRPARDNAIVVHNAREHNLRNVHVRIPRDAFTVVTGVSGSGKSTLAFDILFSEGQRRYLESLNAYARQFVQPAARPDVDAIYGIPPTVAIEQRTSRGGRKSTVATLTEIYHFLRLAWVKLGTQYCPDCDIAIEPQSPDAVAASIARRHRGHRVRVLAPLVVARKGYYTDLAKWAAKKGHRELRVDGVDTPTARWPRLSRFREHTIELPLGEVLVKPAHEAALREALARALEYGNGVTHLQDLDARKPGAVAVFSTRRACPGCGTSFAELDPRLFSFNSPHGWCPHCQGSGLEPGEDDDDEDDRDDRAACGECGGERLNRVARHVRFRGRSIAALTAEPVDSVARIFGELRLAGRDAAIARDLLGEIRDRLAFLRRVGLGYLALDRAAPTLSGGEAQRIRLAAQLGSNLQGVCYVLDEPTIGLHPRDNAVLLAALDELVAHRNTLVVVEHDEETILRADHVIDLGPGAGRLGGRVVAEGRSGDLERNPESVTGRYLARPLRHPARPRRKTTSRSAALVIEGATLHNLDRLTVRVPSSRLVAVTGVSGSGKSTLARDVLHANLRRLIAARTARERRTAAPEGCGAIRGAEPIDRVLEVDQTPIGKTPRSCPATYVGFWDDVRRVYAAAPEAKLRGYTASRFSFNTAGGRCEACEGQGMQTIEMSFLPDVKVPCDVCRGRRFNPETLSVTWRGKSIGDVLAMSVDDAVPFFGAHTRIHHALALLQEVGLGYLTLGQQSPTLSGGEAQRIKLVTELAKAHTGTGARLRAKPVHTLYVLDEPTVGLHMADVERLISALHRLVEAGNSVVVVEHNLDVIAEADWVIDLGPEAGANGGRIVAQGVPRTIASARARSHTGAALAPFLAARAD
ncbi:MAG: UvrABC system protein A [Steroidobacteraceae bacterium]|nr:UvrABC system protein A [Steroidobacteraceae bacterium]